MAANDFQRYRPAIPPNFEESFRLYLLEELDKLSQSFSSLFDVLSFTEGLSLPSFTVSTLPSASPAGKLIYVSDETGGPTVAVSNGTNWLRIRDNVIVS